MNDLASRCFKRVMFSQPNTQLTEIDVENSDPQLANEVSQGFAAFADAQLPGGLQALPAQKPIEPIRPEVLQETGIRRTERYEIRRYLRNAQQKLTFAFTSKGYKAC